MVAETITVFIVAFSLSSANCRRFDSRAPDPDFHIALRPETRPSKREIRNPFVAGEAMVELDRMVNDKGEDKCQDPEYLWEATGVLLGRGSHGHVISVKLVKNVKDPTWEQRVKKSWKNAWAFFDVMGLKKFFRNEKTEFALKVPISEEANENIQKEIDVMRKASENKCRHVMPLVDDHPCLKNYNRPPTSYPFAFVSEKMEGDLSAWLRRYLGTEAVKQCSKEIAAELKEGLLCLHRSGYSHNDFKPDNIFFRKIDKFGCPTGLHIADFGLSMELNTTAPLFPQDYAKMGFHMADTIFEGPGNSLGLKSLNRRFYEVKSIVDWCSYSFLMQDSFGMLAKEIFGASDVVPCGHMGYGRQQAIYAPLWE